MLPHRGPERHPVRPDCLNLNWPAIPTGKRGRLCRLAVAALDDGECRGQSDPVVARGGHQLLDDPERLRALALARRDQVQFIRRALGAATGIAKNDPEGISSLIRAAFSLLDS